MSPEATSAAPSIGARSTTTQPRRKPRTILIGVLLAVSIAVTLPSVPVSARTSQNSGGSATSESQQRYADQITRLYRTTLDREVDAAGHAFWTSEIQAGSDVRIIAKMMMNSPEAKRKTTGDWIVDAYLWALGRMPDETGYDYWSTRNPVDAIVAISDSVEHQQMTKTSAPPLRPLPATTSVAPPTLAESSEGHPSGWVDAGHGVYVPPVLLKIRYCESKHNYQAANPRSSARGAYQFLTASWKAYGHAERYGVSRANQATNAQQDEAAVLTWQRDGTRPWAASRRCWR